MIKAFISVFLMINQPDSVETIVLGGGCFWCTEAVYRNVNGVIDVIPGYSGGSLPDPSYEEVCTGQTGHAEVIRINFNPNIVSFNKILEIFFMTHDPASINRQGADIGTQYRSVIFYTTEKQKEIALEKIKLLNDQKIFNGKIVTEVLPLHQFFKAEEYHQDYYYRNNNQPYCRFVINPKIEKLKKLFPENYKK
jgi:peptide-methionine (S)-S-oxide reductase